MYNYMSESCWGSSISLANWEEDIDDISVDTCEEDPSGFCVTFFKDPMEAYTNDEGSYRIGASLLKNRLDKLRRAGFDAPMTQKAINILNKKRFNCVA